MNSVAQEASETRILPDVRVMRRVDTTNPEVRLIWKSWVDSLSQWRKAALANAVAQATTDTVQPISVKAGMPEGVIKNWFGQSSEILTSFPPTVLSIEPDGARWVVRTMFSAPDSARRTVVPLGILQVRFIKLDAGTWSIQNPLVEKTGRWKEYSTDHIRFLFPNEMSIDKSRAKSASEFVETTARMFRIEPPNLITFYVTRTRDAMCDLLGIEYYSFPPSGLSFPAEHIILSGMGDAWYPHELVHVVFRDYDDACPVIREGVATWLGGSLGDDFDVLLPRYLHQKKAGEVPSFVRLFTDPYLPQDDVYIVGAALCRAVYEKAGPDAVLDLLRARKTSDAMLKISQILGLEPGDRQENLIPLLTQLLQNSPVDAPR